MQRLLDLTDEETDALWTRFMRYEGVIEPPPPLGVIDGCCCAKDKDGNRIGPANGGCKEHMSRTPWIPRLSTLDMRQAGRLHLAGRE